MDSKNWVKDQGTVEMEEGNKSWMEIVAKLKSMKISEKQNHEISLFIMASYDLDTFRKFVFKSSFLKRFDIAERTIKLIKTNDEELLQFSMDWLLYALFSEGSIRPKT